MTMRIMSPLIVKALFADQGMYDVQISARDEKIWVIHSPTGYTEDYTTQDLMMSDNDFVNNRVKLFMRRVSEELEAGQAQEPTTSVALKNDADKDPWHLAPWDAIRCIVKVMAFGAKKYAPRNWEKGFEWHRLHRATIEHLNSWWMGEDKDPETGYSHLWHAGCCILFLIAHELRSIGKDDRPSTTRDKTWADAANSDRKTGDTNV